MSLRTLFGSLLLSISLQLQAATEVISLNYRTADDLLPVAQSMLGHDGRVSTYGNQLIVNAPEEKLAELRALISQLDTRPRRLLISVDTSDQALNNNSGYAVNGSISAGDVQVDAGRGEVQGRDQVRIIRHSTASRSGGTQQVQATEGYPALIQVGQSVPLTTTSTGPYGQIYSNTQYQNVMQGFYATVTLVGDRVSVVLSSSNDRLSQSQPGAIDVQSTDTRVSGRLGEWIPVGGVSSQQQADQSGLLRQHSTRGQNDMSMRLKVEALD